MAGNPALKKGYVLNPSGVNGTKASRTAHRKASTALDKAIDLLGVDPNKTGIVALSELIRDKLQDDVVGTLKGLSFLFPKDINVDVQHTMNPLQLTDDQLIEIIESRQKVIKEVGGEVIEVDK